MSKFLSIWAVVNAVIGVLFFAISGSAISSIEGGMAFLIATVALGSVGVMEAIKASRK